MIELQFDFSEFEDAARRWGGAADQVPYAASRTLNDAVFKARQVLVASTWPSHVHVRNPYFINAALRVEESTKHNLEASLYDVLDRGGAAVSLQRHARGGIKTSASGKRLAIPAKNWVRYGTRGVVARQRPAALIAKGKGVVVTATGIFQREGERLHLRYSLKGSAQQPQDVPLYEDFMYTVSNALRTGFIDMLAKAMHTAR